MKKLLLILLCLPMIGFGQDIFDKFKNEEEIKKYLDEKSTDPIEGIYEYNSKGFSFLNLGNNRLALIKDNEEYIFIHIDALPVKVK